MNRGGAGGHGNGEGEGRRVRGRKRGDREASICEGSGHPCLGRQPSATSSGMERPSPSQPRRPSSPSGAPPAPASTSREGNARETGPPRCLARAGRARHGAGLWGLTPSRCARRRSAPFPRTLPWPCRGDAPRHRGENRRQNHSRHLLIPTPDRRASAAKSVFLLAIPYPQMPPVGLFPGRMNVSATTHLNSA